MTDKPINPHTRAPHQPAHAVIVEDAYDPSVLGKIAYEIRLTCPAPSVVELRFTLNGMVYGSMPFDNLVKAATRIDPDHAVGTELQIQKLRRESASALAEMYDWRARAERAEAKLAAFSEAAKA